MRSPTRIAAARQDLREDAAAPVATHRGLQAWQRFVHALAGRRLAVDDEPRVADAKNAAARVCESDAADQQVRAASGRVDVSEEFRHQPVPDFPLEQRHLTTPAAIDVADEATSCFELCLVHWIHRTAMHALYEDSVETAGGCFRHSGFRSTARGS